MVQKYVSTSQWDCVVKNIQTFFSVPQKMGFVAIPWQRYCKVIARSFVERADFAETCNHPRDMVPSSTGHGRDKVPGAYSVLAANPLTQT
jgi:hypothetical protein